MAKKGKHMSNSRRSFCLTLIFWCAVLPALFLIASCAANQPGLEIAMEYKPQDEEQQTSDLTRLLMEKMEKDYQHGKMLRGAHPKHHGCLRTQFVIEANLPQHLRVGVFTETKTYPAWVRFSSSAPKVQPDSKRDVLGMAIKLMDVDGEKLLEDEKDESTQDFLLISHPVLLVGNVKDFLKLTDSAINGGLFWFFLNPFDLHLKEIVIGLKALKRHANPLHTRYWSTTPYLFGPGQAVKYSAFPCAGLSGTIAKKSGPGYLRQAMKKELAQDEACFDFMVQIQTDPQKMPIEDARTNWDETLSPFIKVATLKIPSQVFDSPGQMDFCEDLSFTPWHSLSEHRPLGGINRARKQIYRDLSIFRHEQNNKKREEPQSSD